MVHRATIRYHPRTMRPRHTTSIAMQAACGLLVLISLGWALPAAAGTLDRVKETGVFRIGYRADAKPYSYRDENGQPAGYIVDLCLEVAAAVRADVGDQVRMQYVLVPADQR